MKQTAHTSQSISIKDMRKHLLPAAFLCMLTTLQAQTIPQTFRTIEHGTYSIRLLLHTIGSEEYTITESPTGERIVSTTSTSSDRGMKHTTASTLKLGPELAPVTFEQHSGTPTAPEKATPENSAQVQITATTATIREASLSRTIPRPSVAFVGFTSMSASTQMMMMRYWKLHHQPAQLKILRASDKSLPLEIHLVGHEAFTVNGRTIRLTRYTVANLLFGREVLWMNDHGRLAAVMTFAGGLPQEEILDQYESAASELYRSGVTQEVLDLADLDREVAPQATGSFAIVGARLVDGTNHPGIENSTVIIRDGRIAAAGPASTTTIPAGVRIIRAPGKTLVPGLWEMHTHYSGVEFGPAFLAAGITTARDCGGEFEFLTTLRDRIEKNHSLGPRLLLAGLIDSGGPLSFGYVDVHTPAEAVAAVDQYADARFEQIKVYTQLQPDVLKAITAEAHQRGMTVTGHVPAAINAFDGVADGMDQINHLQFVIRAMNPDGGIGPVDLNSDRSKRLIALLKDRQIVVDPTNDWGEMAGHPRDLDLATFEPGINAAPYTLQAKYRGLGVPASDAAKFRERMDTNKQVVGALYRAGVRIVAGSDTGLPGYGLYRELELYVQAGMTPLAAIQSATIVPARVMNLEKESGSIETGKRADLMLVDGNPLTNISDIRRVVSVVTNGRMYDSKKLARSVGFNR